MSTAPNLREQFNIDTQGYAHFNAYCRALVDKKPAASDAADVLTNEADRRAMFDKYPMDRPYLDAEWLRLWDEAKRYLESPGTSWVRFPTGWFYLARGKVGDLLAATMRTREKRLHMGALSYRVTIDGTIVKEWGAIGEQIREGMKKEFKSKMGTE